MSINSSIDSSDSYALTPTHNAATRQVRKQRIIMTMQCEWKFEAQNKNELELEKGDIIYVTDCLGDWNVGICERTSTKGYFPPNYCSTLEDDDIPMPRNEALRKILVFPEDEEQEAVKKIWRAYSNYKFRKVVNKSLSKVRHRKSVLSELLEGERAYVEYMKVLKDLYSIPLKPKLSDAEHKQIFSHIEVVIKVANTFLQILEEANMSDTKIMEIFVKNSAFLKQYTGFVMNMDNATSIIDSKCQKDKEFKKFLKVQRLDKRSNRQDLKSLLAKPFQRLIGYRNLIERLKQLTPKESFKYEQLEKAYQEIESIIEHINEKKRHHDDTKIMIRIQNSLMDKSGTLKQNLIRGWRTPIYEGKVLLQKPDMNNFAVLQVFLMSDVLFFVKDKDLSVFYLSFTRISQSKESPFIYNLDGFRQKCKLKFKDETDKNTWMNAFANAYDVEKEYAKENNIHGSIPSMIKDYSEMFSTNLRNANDEITRKVENFESVEKSISLTNERISEKKKGIESLLKEIITNQEERKNHKLKAEELRKDFYKIKTEKQQNIEKCLTYLQTFHEVLRRDREAYEDLFGEDIKWLEQEKNQTETLNLNPLNSEVIVEEQGIETLSSQIEALTSGENRELDEEMKSIKKIVQGIELEEHSFNMIASSASLKKRLQDSKKHNLELSQKVEELKRQLKSKEDALAEEKARIASYINDSHSNDQIQLLTNTLLEAEKKLVEIHGWREQQMQIFHQASSDKEQTLILKDEVEKLKEENERMKTEIARVMKENESLRKQYSQKDIKLPPRIQVSDTSSSELANRKSSPSSTPKESLSCTRLESPPPIPPRAVAGSIKDRAKLFEDKGKEGENSSPPPLPSRHSRTPSGSDSLHQRSTPRSSPLTIEVYSSNTSSSTDSKEMQDLRFSLQQRTEQNDRLQGEIIELRKKLEESRKEKAKLIDESRDRMKKVFSLQGDQLKYFTQSQETLYQNNRTLAEVLQKERSKAATYEKNLLTAEQEKFREMEKLWEQDRIVDDFRTTIEKLRLELIQSQYKMTFLERLVDEGPQRKAEEQKLHRRTSASDLPKEFLSPRSNRRMSMAINATTTNDIQALLNQKLPDRLNSTPDRPIRPVEIQKRSVSPLHKEVSEATAIFGSAVTSPPSSEVENETHDRNEKKKKKGGFFGIGKKKSPPRNEYRNTLSAAPVVDTSDSRKTKAKSMATSVSMSQFPQVSSSATLSNPLSMSINPSNSGGSALGNSAFLAELQQKLAKKKPSD